jgi:SRSO17 transposase
MKKLYFLTLIFPAIIFAQSYLISNIPLPKTYIQNLDPYPCDENCRQTYLDNDMIFSFLSHADAKLENEEQDEVRKMSISILNLGSSILTEKLRIALLLPYKVIGRYASSTTNASFAYLIAKNHSFELKSYKVESESVEDIQKALQQISQDGFYYVIAPLTQKGANAIGQINPDMNIFFPTINKKDVTSTSSYLVYGGIDYQAQSDMLLKEAVSPLVIFYDKSSIGKKLSSEEIETQIVDANKTVVKFSIPKRTTNLEKQLFENEEIVEGSFFINTPIVKTGMIMSQLTLYDTNATNVLSTQINYDPLILSMTQYEDRKNMVIANSITQNNNILIETNSLLGNDIVYDWINYTTTVGVDYFFNLATREDREYNIAIEDNQMIYPIELLNPSRYRFIKHISAIEE